MSSSTPDSSLSLDARVRAVDPRAAFSSRNVICLAILCFVNLINYMDRYTVSSALKDVSEELCRNMKPDICDTKQLGLLQTAFVLVYFVVAPVFGYLGDRYSRKYIMAGGVLVWGSISLGASFMNTYWPFLILRSSIAIGESAFTTIAPTVLGDLFNEDSRSLVLGIFYLAIPVGSGLGYVVGGAPTDWHNGLRITPGLNFIAFILILVFLVDPPRGVSDHKSAESSSYLEDIKYIMGIKSFLLNVAGFTCVTFTTGALSWYGPTYVKYGLQSCTQELDSGASNKTGSEGCEIRIVEDNVDFLFGVILMISGILGVLSGMLLSKFLRPKYPRIDPIICGTSLLLSCPLLIYGVITAKDDLVVAFAMIGVGCTFLNMNWSISVDMSLYVIVPLRRATAEAIHLMATHALGEAGAPYIIGVISDQLINKECPDEKDCPNIFLTKYEALQKSMYLAFALLFLGGLLFLGATFWILPEKLQVDRLLDKELRELDSIDETKKMKPKQ